MDNSDLISRKALREEVKTLFWSGSYKSTILQLIDNAPAIEEKSYAMGYQDGLEDGLDGIRPQGEWIDTMYGFHTCSICGKYGNPNFFNFCPNCGAKMKGGAK